MEIEQLGKSMVLLQINPIEIEELGLTVNLHENDFESNNSLEVRNNELSTEKHILEEEEQKMAKI